MISKRGQSVVALDDAEEIGKVKHFVVARDVSRIERLHIDGRGKHALFTGWEDIESFGPDRVMVKAAGALSESDDERDRDAAKGNLDLIGSRILDTAGFDRGNVADALFDEATGTITQISSTDGTDIDAERIHSLGSYAGVVDP